MLNSRNGHISITGVSKYFGRHKALDDVSLEIAPGTVTVILGPSGSGKSTLLRAINHLERVDEGFIQIDGDYIGYRRKGDKLYELKEKEILRQRINVGYVFQNFNLIARTTAQRNVELPMLYAGVDGRTRAARAAQLLEKVGMGQRRTHQPSELSGGQKQRVAIARALANDPAILLADEPTGALDSQTSRHVMDIFHGLHRQGKTIVLITHSRELAAECPRIITLRDGCIVADQRKEARHVPV